MKPHSPCDLMCLLSAGKVAGESIEKSTHKTRRVLCAGTHRCVPAAELRAIARAPIDGAAWIVGLCPCAMGSQGTPQIKEAASLIRASKYLIAFTGAGISVESGIPPFRGPGGLWSRYDPRMLELDYFLAHPDIAWPVIREIFYDHFGKATPNKAHEVLAAWEAHGILKTLITQNIDNLHYLAGSRNIVEFHGNSRLLVCLACSRRVEAARALLEQLPPRCSCGGMYKPDFIFFGEGIPQHALAKSRDEARRTDVMLVVGSTGEVYPAALVPRWASEARAKIIEINPEASEFTGSVSHVHVRLKAAEAFELIHKEMHT